ncbi:MAG TPA: hypothetical protein PLI64_14915 [Phycisphaerae bacterium]|nr:hypothetical protein [Phycisphaerae bacterium]HOL27810.1 hypothetical protein [Phycisphaerae bacterium]HPP22261.1 hypothetical protein [Phycisphaerae bacterium]HQA44760.1 hypothetical protein [Phycisphaerae bacterium]
MSRRITDNTRWVHLLCFAVALCVPEVLFATEPSRCRLSIHLIANYSPGARQIIEAHPPVIKILDLHNSMIEAMRAYKAGTPNGRVVLRIYTQKRYTASDDPAASARDFWNTVLAPAVNGLSASDRALIDYLEGPNECESTPCWGGTLADAQWFNDFWVELAQKIADGGFKPCAFSIPVGNPPGTPEDMRARLDKIAPALRKCKQLGGAWSYHSYTGLYTTDAATEYWYALRYRQFYEYFATAHPDLVNLPIILTEGGVDTGGSPTGSGWQAHGNAAQYKNWLTWFDARLREDPQVIGCTLFQIGDASGWPSFELEPIAEWLARQIAVGIPPTIQYNPAHITASVQRGQNAPAATLTVKNVGANTLNYSITVDKGWLSVNPVSGTSTGEEDAITVSYTTAGLQPGTYTAMITVADANASNSPQGIPVTLTIWEPPQPGDLNGDRYVDVQDVRIFVGCMTGANSEPVATECQKADMDSDGDVDQSDFGLLQRCFSGTALGDPHCAD